MAINQAKDQETTESYSNSLEARVTGSLIDKHGISLRKRSMTSLTTFSLIKTEAKNKRLRMAVFFAMSVYRSVLKRAHFL